VGVRVLLRASEIEDARAKARTSGLSESPDPRKYWDNMLALERIRGHGVQPTDPIADLGCRSGILLTWLDQLGYRRLFGCDLRVPLPPIKAAISGRHWTTAWAGLKMLSRHGRRMRRASVENSPFSGGFAAVCCMSVIEHGVDLTAFFQEAARLLRPGGLLVVSTDYWASPMDLAGLRRFERAGDDRVFSREDIERLIEIAGDTSFTIAGPVSLDVAEPVIESDGFHYTFAVLFFVRHGDLAA
jgi:SAM-dependent methyltransferase